MYRRRGAYIAILMVSVGAIGVAIADAISNGPVDRTRLPLALWGLFAVSATLFILGGGWVLVIWARLRREIAGR